MASLSIFVVPEFTEGVPFLKLPNKYTTVNT